MRDAICATPRKFEVLDSENIKNRGAPILDCSWKMRLKRLLFSWDQHHHPHFLPSIVLSLDALIMKNRAFGRVSTDIICIAHCETMRLYWEPGNAPEFSTSSLVDPGAFSNNGRGRIPGILLDWSGTGCKGILLFEVFSGEVGINSAASARSDGMLPFKGWGIPLPSRSEAAASSTRSTLVSFLDASDFSAYGTVLSVFAPRTSLLSGSSGASALGCRGRFYK